MLRVGTVSEVNEDTWSARVHFKDAGIVSGWLKVVKNAPFIPAKDEEQRTEKESGSSFSSHSHEVIITPYFPSVGDAVLCVYADGSNADGYILGGL